MSTSTEVDEDDFLPTPYDIMMALATITDEPGSTIQLVPGSGHQDELKTLTDAISDFTRKPDWHESQATPDFIRGLMDEENGAWEMMLAEIKEKVGHDIAPDSRLAVMLAYWGEALVKLRLHQKRHVIERAYTSRYGDMLALDAGSQDG